MQGRPKLNMRKLIPASYCLGPEYMQEVMINGGSLKYHLKSEQVQNHLICTRGIFKTGCYT